MLTEEKRKLELEAANIRKTALETIHTAGSGHIGGSFSMAEIVTVLYFKAMNIDPKDPDKRDRDRLVLSKGHCSPVMYTALARRGFFPVEHLKTFRKIDSDLSGHVEIHVPGVDMSGGSLGQGLSVALGMAMYGKCNNLNNYVYAIMGDGEPSSFAEPASAAYSRLRENAITISEARMPSTSCRTIARRK